MISDGIIFKNVAHLKDSLFEKNYVGKRKLLFGNKITRRLLLKSRHQMEELLSHKRIGRVDK